MSLLTECYLTVRMVNTVSGWDREWELLGCMCVCWVIMYKPVLFQSALGCKVLTHLLVHAHTRILCD